MSRLVIIAGSASSLVNFRGPLILALRKEGHEVDAIAPAADQKTLDWLADHDVGFHDVPLERAGISPIGDFATFRSIFRILGDIRPDATLAYTIKPVVWGTLAAWARGVPQRHAMITGLGYAFTNEQSSIKRRFINVAARFLYKYSLAKAHTVIFQNPDDLGAFRDLNVVKAGQKTAIVNGSGVDISHFGFGPLPANMNFLMVSRLVADKGVVEYINAARIVRQSYPEAEFHLVGPYDPNPSALPLGLMDSAIANGDVIYHGELEDIRPIMQGCSVFMLPSYREGTPRSVLEAMSMGRPIITTDAPGCRETVIDGVNGFLVPVRAVPALVDAACRFITDPQLKVQMGRASRELAVSRYEAGKVAKTIIDACQLQRL